MLEHVETMSAMSGVFCSRTCTPALSAALRVRFAVLPPPVGTQGTRARVMLALLLLPNARIGQYYVTCDSASMRVSDEQRQVTGAPCSAASFFGAATRGTRPGYQPAGIAEGTRHGVFCDCQFKLVNTALRSQSTRHFKFEAFKLRAAGDSNWGIDASVT
eukprot:1130075-Rhodomonas_salina.1